MMRKRSQKEIKYFRSLQTQMLEHRAYFLSGAAKTDTTWRSSRTKLQHRRRSVSKKHDVVRHVAASLQHDLWS